MHHTHARRLGVFAVLVLATSCAPAQNRPAAPAAPPPPPAVMTPTAAADEVADAAPVAPAPTPAATAALTLHMSGVALPGAAAPASLDYIAVDRAAGRMWVPVGNTGSVDVFDIAKGTFTRVDGFATAEREGETENGRSDPAP